MTQLECDVDSRATVVQLPEELTIAESGEFYQRFSALVDLGEDISLDGAAVTRIDTAFIQLLYQFQHALTVAKHELHWRAVSPAIRHAVKLLGMSQQLALPDDI